MGIGWATAADIQPNLQESPGAQSGNRTRTPEGTGF
jgi:hypothetical protein